MTSLDTSHVVKLANRADDKRIEQQGLLPNMRAVCQAVQKNGKRCTSEARWSFTLDDESEVAVCRHHANAGERAGTLHVAPSTRGWTPPAPLPRNWGGVVTVAELQEELPVMTNPRGSVMTGGPRGWERVRSFRLSDRVYAHLGAVAAARRTDRTKLLVELILSLPAPKAPGKKGKRP